MNEIIEKARAALEEKGYTPIFISLYGSQNYGVSTPESDYDFKAMVAPKFNDLVFERKQTSTTIEFPYGLIDVKSPKNLIECWKKQNVNYVELLFSSLYYINEEYREPIELLLNAREDIARFNEAAALRCIQGMQQQKFHALHHPYPTKKHLIEKYGYDGKQLHHILRLEMLCRSYVYGLPYGECLKVPECIVEWLTNIKTFNTVLSNEDVDSIAAISMRETNNLIDNYLPKDINKEVLNLFNKVCIDLTKIAIKKELNEKEMK